MFLPIQLDRTSPAPLQDQIFEQLRDMIVSGQLKPNSRVIGTRFLAEQSGVSRTTVLLAYERLISEGYLDTRPSVGTFVASEIPDALVATNSSEIEGEVQRQATVRPAIFDGQQAETPDLSNVRYDFGGAHSDGSELLPASQWLRVMRKILEEHPRGLAEVQPAAGLHVLRRAIADRLAATRGLMVTPDQIIVVLGRRQACSIVGHLFQGPGDRVVLEEPIDDDTAEFFESRKAQLCFVAVDNEGLRSDLLPDGESALVYVTPARQSPLGGILPSARRERLMAWAREAGAYIIEDDSSAAFHYQAAPPPPIASFDPHGMVFCLGGFAHTLGAGLSVGYLVVPREFVEPAVTLKAMSEDGCSWIEQMLVAELLTSGEYASHVRRLRKTYLDRRDCLTAALQRHFGEVTLSGTESGTAITWHLPQGFPSAREVRRLAFAEGIHVQAFPARAAHGNGAKSSLDRILVLHYSALGCDGIEEGITRLAGILRPHIQMN